MPFYWSSLNHWSHWEIIGIIPLLQFWPSHMLYGKAQTCKYSAACDSICIKTTVSKVCNLTELITIDHFTSQDQFLVFDITLHPINIYSVYLFCFVIDSAELVNYVFMYGRISKKHNINCIQLRKTMALLICISEMFYGQFHQVKKPQIIWEHT